jgi:hypothetical protein
MRILPKQRIPRITILYENCAAAVHPEKSGQDLQRSRGLCHSSATAAEQVLDLSYEIY